jgi:predicted lipase
MDCKEVVFKQLENYLLNGYRVIFTGCVILIADFFSHSQGAAVSIIMATHIGYYFPGYQKQLQSITFGSPKVGNKEFAEYFNSMYPDAQRFDYIGF